MAGAEGLAEGIGGGAEWVAAGRRGELAERAGEEALVSGVGREAVEWAGDVGCRSGGEAAEGAGDEG